MDVMDVFKVHRQVIEDYRSFTSGFVSVRNARIKDFVDQQFAEGVQWPDPWLSLNPFFASGGAVPELVEQGLRPSVTARPGVVPAGARCRWRTRRHAVGSSQTHADDRRHLRGRRT